MRCAVPFPVLLPDVTFVEFAVRVTGEFENEVDAAGAFIGGEFASAVRQQLLGQCIPGGVGIGRASCRERV